MIFILLTYIYLEVVCFKEKYYTIILVHDAPYKFVHTNFYFTCCNIKYRDKILSKVSAADARNMNVLRGQANELSVSYNYYFN